MNNIGSASPGIKFPDQLVAPRPRGNAEALHDNEVLRKARDALDNYRVQSTRSTIVSRTAVTSCLYRWLEPATYGQAGSLDLSACHPEAVEALPHDVIEALASRTSKLLLPPGSRPSWLKDLSKLTELTVRQPGKELDLTDVKSLKQLKCVKAGRLETVHLPDGTRVDTGERAKTRGVGIAYYDKDNKRILSPQRASPVQTKLMRAYTAEEKGTDVSAMQARLMKALTAAEECNAGSPMQTSPMVARTAEEKGKARVLEPVEAPVVASSSARKRSDGPNSSQAARATDPAAHESRALGSAQEPSPAQVQPGDAPNLPQDETAPAESSQRGQKPSGVDEFEQYKDSEFGSFDAKRIWKNDRIGAADSANTRAVMSKGFNVIKKEFDASMKEFDAYLRRADKNIEVKPDSERSDVFVRALDAFIEANRDLSGAQPSLDRIAERRDYPDLGTKGTAYTRPGDDDAETPENKAAPAESSRRRNNRSPAMEKKINRELGRFESYRALTRSQKDVANSDEYINGYMKSKEAKQAELLDALRLSPTRVQPHVSGHAHQPSSGGLDVRLANMSKSLSDPNVNVRHLDLAVVPRTPSSVRKRKPPRTHGSSSGSSIKSVTRDGQRTAQQAEITEKTPDAESSSARIRVGKTDARWDVMRLLDKDEDGWTPLAKAFKEKNPDPINLITQHFAEISAQAETPALDTLKTLKLNGMLVGVLAARDPHGKPGPVHALESGNAASIRSYGEGVRKVVEHLDLDQHDRARLADILDSAVNFKRGFVRVPWPAYSDARRDHPEAFQEYEQLIRDLRGE